MLVNSSVIDRVNYVDGDLLITFKKSQKTYRYLNVPSRVYGEILKANSIGSYFNQVIKPRFECQLEY